jgi:putative ABC transport system ATP-binding protein
MVMETLRDLARRQDRAVVIVTHDSRGQEYGDRVVHIEDGRILSDSSTPEFGLAAPAPVLAGT